MARNFIGSLQMENKKYLPGATVGGPVPKEFTASENGYTVSIGTADDTPSFTFDTTTQDVTYTSSISLDDYTLTNDTGGEFTFNMPPDPVLFGNTLPSLETIEDMCVEYPALKVAYDKFKTVYKMCETDYIGKKVDD